MNFPDSQQNPDLDRCLIQLADILNELGVEEFTVTDFSQHHVINHEMNVNPEVVDQFCKNINALYLNIIKSKLG